MATIHIAEATSSIIVFRKEQRRVRAFGRVLIKEPVNRTEEPLQFVNRDRALSAQVGLQVGHQEGGGNSLSRDVPNHKSNPATTQIEKVVIITADLPGLNTYTRVVQRGKRWQRLREKPGLHLLCDFQFLGGASLGLQLLGRCTPLRIKCLAHLIKAHKRERILVDVFEARKHPSPNRAPLAQQHRLVGRRLISLRVVILDALQARYMAKLHTPLGPLMKLGDDIVGDKRDLRGASYELGFSGATLWLDQRQNGRAVRRSHGNPAFTGLQTGVINQSEPKLVEIEFQASILISNVDLDRVKTKVGVAFFGRKSRLI